ncbi:hypothetical protein EDD15DRAFT_2381694 [Pisolithus albus]|nr:hypothetical protein EDD15DRAFT_2381694 [Pisolithus albus]
MSVRWVLSEVETVSFLEHLFSDERAFSGIAIKTVLKHLEQKELWDGSRWQAYPLSDDYSEANIAAFFNEILDNLPTDLFLCKRRWTGKGANKPLNGFSGAVRKPDLMLCEDSTIKKCKVLEERQFDLRTDVYVIGELKNRYGTDNVRASFIELAGKVVFQLENQDGRYATPGLQILGDHIILTLFDRGGSISTHPLHIHQRPEAFLRVLLGITFGDAVVLGFDTTISPVEEGKKKIQIIRDGKECFILVDQLLFISGSLHGRGTTVWSGVVTQADFPELEEGQKVVIKDSFVDPLRRYTEGRILKILEDNEIKGVPRLLHEQQVQASHPLDSDLQLNQSTHILHSLIKDPLPADCKYHLRILSRLVSTPKGDPIYDFSSLAELLVGLIDCLKAHFDAFEIAGVLHRDISLFNLLLYVLANGDECRIDFLQSNVLDDAERTRLEEKIKAQVTRRGLLADWGYVVPALKCGTDASPGESPCSGLNRSPNLYVRSPGDSETKTKLQNLLEGKDSIVIPMVGESIPNDANTPIDASPLHRTGTWAWMATELSHTVPGTPVVHQPHHDLESFFYILLAICLLYDTPGTTKPPKTLAECFDPLFAISQPSVAKTLAIQAGFGWTALILPYISSYFQPLIPLLDELRRELLLPIRLERGIVQPSSGFTHHMFIDGMVKILSRLPDSSWIPYPKDSSVSTVTRRSSTSSTALLPPIVTTALLSSDSLSRHSPLRMTGTSSGSAGVKRPLDDGDDVSNSRGKKRAQLNTQPADASGSGTHHDPLSKFPKPRNPSSLDASIQKLRLFSSAPR